MKAEITSMDSASVDVGRAELFSVDSNRAAESAPRSGLAIREATLGDASAIARIHVETWRSAYRGIIPAAHLDSLSVEQRTRGWEQNLGENRARVLVAEVDDTVMGWVS